jgi:DUF1680 family protein
MIQNFSKGKTLPLGAIKAQGFLKEQLERNKNGMGGHLPEIEPGMIANPFINKTYVKQWGEGDQSGWGAEISGNYYAGLIQLAFTLDDDELKTMAEIWVNGFIKNQREDGYLGTYYEPDALIHDDYNAWELPAGCVPLFYYEATEGMNVFDAVYRCMLWFTENWTGDKKTCYAGELIIEPMIACYHKTGDERLLQFAKDYTEYLVEHTTFFNSYKDFLDPKLHYNCNHTAAYGQAVRLPAILYTATGEEKYLRSSEIGIKKMQKKSVQLTGAPVSVTEYVGPTGAVQESEFCSFTFFNISYIFLNAITGKSIYSDYMEQLVYNAVQGAKKKDERAIAYLTAPNQIFATQNSSNTYHNMQVYSPCFPVSCCPVNSVAVVPEFIRGMAMSDAEDNLYICAYGPCSIKYKGWNIEEKTMYPFRNDIALKIISTGSGSLFCKIPQWAKKYTVLVNCKEVNAKKNANGYIRINGTGVIQLSFHADVEVISVNDSDCANKRPLAFRYGALLFSLKIEASWNKFYPNTETQLKPEWPWFNVEPVYPKVECTDAHERLGLRRDKFPWSVAVKENLSAKDVLVELCETDGYPWDEPFIKLHVNGYKAPLLNAPYAQRTFEPFGNKVEVTEQTELTLVPYGLTNLRITYFPRADV